MSFTMIRYNMIAELSRNVMDRVHKQSAKGLLALSSGKRINSTEDDASGFAMARGLEARRRGLTQALSNISNAESLMRIAAGSYDVINTSLLRVKDLLMQGADDSFSDVQRAAIQGQIDALIDEVDVTVKSTTFQGEQLLDGSFSNRRFQTGSEAGQVFLISLADVRASALALAGIDTSSHESATAGLAQIDAALATLYEGMQSAGEVLSRLASKQLSTQDKIVKIEATRSRLEDLDFANQRMKMARVALVQQLGFEAMKEAVVAPRHVISLFAR